MWVSFFEMINVIHYFRGYLFWSRRYYHNTTEDTDFQRSGSIFPLWRFSTDKNRRNQITRICWNPKYRNLFAVGYVYYDFLKEIISLIYCYTIKNPHCLSISLQLKLEWCALTFMQKFSSHDCYTIRRNSYGVWY